MHPQKSARKCTHDDRTDPPQPDLGPARPTARDSRRDIDAAGAAARIKLVTPGAAGSGAPAHPRLNLLNRPSHAPATASAPKPQGHQQQPRQGQATEEEEVLPEGRQQPTASGSGKQYLALSTQWQCASRSSVARATFVGPMDHSYRARTATWPMDRRRRSSSQQWAHGSYYPDAYVGSADGRPIKADAPTRIFCFIDDLFFQAKIQETARKLGVKVEFVKGEKETVARIIDSPEAPTLVVFDLNNLNAKPMTLIPKFKTKFKKATSVIGFLNHLQGDLKMKAIESGCDTVMPRSAFSQSLPNLLRRYGMEEEEDNMPQPM